MLSWHGVVERNVDFIPCSVASKHKLVSLVSQRPVFSLLFASGKQNTEFVCCFHPQAPTLQLYVSEKRWL